jgi:DNA-binding CsgD family transcriptional regulator
MRKTEDRHYLKRDLYEIDSLSAQSNPGPGLSMRELLLEKDRKIEQLERLLDLKTQEIWQLRNQNIKSVEVNQDLRQDQLTNFAYDQVSAVATGSQPAAMVSFMLRLKTRFPTLSANDLRICALLRHNLSTKEVAHRLGIGADSANKARYRIRRKLSLKRGDDLVYFLLQC